MTIHKTQMRRQARDHRQQRKFFLALGLITLLLILVLYLVYG